MLKYAARTIKSRNVQYSSAYMKSIMYEFPAIKHGKIQYVLMTQKTVMQERRLMEIHKIVLDRRRKSFGSTLCVKKNVTLFTATCFSNVAVMGSLDVRPSVCLSVRNVGEQ